MGSKLVVSITIVSGDQFGAPATLELSSNPIELDDFEKKCHQILYDLRNSARWLMRGGTLHPTDPWGKEEME